MIIEKLVGGTAYVERIYEMAQLADLDVIKLAWRQTGYANAELTGLEVPVVVRNRQNSNIVTEDITEMVSFEDGVTYFYADENKVRWGYVIATENNLVRLAEALASGVFVVRSKSYIDKIKNIAIRNGWRTEPGVAMHESIVVSDREKKALDKTTKLENELVEARRIAAEAVERAERLEQSTALAKLGAEDKKVFAPLPGMQNEIESDPSSDPIGAGADAFAPKTGRARSK